MFASTSSNGHVTPAFRGNFAAWPARRKVYHNCPGEIGMLALGFPVSKLWIFNLTLRLCERSCHDPPRTRTWNLRLRRPTPYPLGQRADGAPSCTCSSIFHKCTRRWLPDERSGAAPENGIVQLVLIGKPLCEKELRSWLARGRWWQPDVN